MRLELGAGSTNWEMAMQQENLGEQAAGSRQQEARSKQQAKIRMQWSLSSLCEAIMPADVVPRPSSTPCNMYHGHFSGVSDGSESTLH